MNGCFGLGHVSGIGFDQRSLTHAGFWFSRCGCCYLVLKAGLKNMERGRHAKDRLTFLNGFDAAGGKAPAIPDLVDLIDDGAGGVAWP